MATANSRKPNRIPVRAKYDGITELRAARKVLVAIAYLLTHCGGGSISAAGACPASFRPLPAKYRKSRTLMTGLEL